MFGAIFILLVVVTVIAFAVWNFVPSIREKLKSWSTVIEGTWMAFLGIFGQITDGLREAQAAGYIPTQWLGYLPYVLLAWMILKRFMTSTPVGQKN